MSKNLLTLRSKYNLIQNIFQQKAKITYRQLLKYLKHKITLTVILNLFDNQVNFTEEYENLLQYISIRVYIKMQENVILAILNIEAYISVIIKLLVMILSFK